MTSIIFMILLLYIVWHMDFCNPAVLAHQLSHVPVLRT